MNLQTSPWKLCPHMKTREMKFINLFVMLL